MDTLLSVLVSSPSFTLRGLTGTSGGPDVAANLRKVWAADPTMDHEINNNMISIQIVSTPEDYKLSLSTGKMSWSRS